MEQHALKIVNSCLNTNIYSFLGASDGQSSYIYLNVVHFFSMPVVIRHLWLLKTAVFLHWYYIMTGDKDIASQCIIFNRRISIKNEKLSFAE